MPIRRTRLLPRTTNVRDARLFVIATEGQQTERQYFEGFNSPRVKVQVLGTGAEGLSAPRWVLDRLKDFEAEYALTKEDQRWLVLDVDRWIPRHLAEVCSEALQQGYRLGISNPCFELFLYLHFSDPDFNRAEFQALLSRHRQNHSAAVEAWLRRRLKGQGGYNKGNIKFARFRPHIPQALARARSLDTAPDERWPTRFPGTHVYRLVEELYRLLPPE